MNYLLAAAILLIDLAVFFVPVCALFIAYVLCFKPKWVLNSLKKFYGEV